MNKILVVEDDENLNLLYKSVLEKNNFIVFCAANGLEALAVLEKEYIDLIISDIMMPDMDGFEFAQSLRDANFQTPIMLITAKDSFTDKKRGFELGIDDYMVKPIDVNEMVLRVEALLRRAQIAHNKELLVGHTRLDQETFQVTWGQQTELLPQKEFLLLFKLLSYPDKIFTRHQLMEEIWGPDSDSEERTIDVHIKRLRARFQTNPDFQIVTIRGLGYKAAIS
ncbi:response regulator transcription factor [Enterococcus sp. CSURQ0835]|uniref:response regulator transcription factor n=1 Tax=Enterococcus sp. CSURQ0835 TaxID=2681394 RepID=UPI0013599DC0|nr:response regulator transcription factor [Enterococcus sp. CSURQ0835]